MLSATTAFGKTVVAAWLIAQRGANTLVLVHRRQLLDQWIERLSTFLDLPAKAIGRIGGGRSKPNGLVDVAVIQSLVRKGVVDDRVGDYGQVTRFVVGLSATLTRKDGHHPIIFMQCGPVRHHVDAKAQAATRPFEHLVIVRPTAFQSASSTGADKRMEFQASWWTTRLGIDVSATTSPKPCATVDRPSCSRNGTSTSTGSRMRSPRASLT